jgi:transcriptional regulator with XRE-family HTH domain
LKIKDLIRDLRLKNNYTLVQLAELLGCKHSTIVAWENGINEPGPKYLYKLNKVFNVELLSLLNENDNNDNISVASEPMPVYQKSISVEKSKENSKDIYDSLYELIKNNEKLIDNNTKLVETNAMLSKFVMEYKKEREFV